MEAESTNGGGLEHLPPFETLEGGLVVPQPVLSAPRFQVTQQEVQQKRFPFPECSWIVQEYQEL
jgi:hypothetical protein